MRVKQKLKAMPNGICPSIIVDKTKENEQIKKKTVFRQRMMNN